MAPKLRDILGPRAEADGTHRAWPIPASFDAARLARGRVLFAGDAANVVDPMTGEGIAQALETGILAAHAIEGDATAQGVTTRYRRDVERGLGTDLWFARALQQLLCSPLGARATIRGAGLTPWTRRNFARWMFEDYPRAALLTPRALASRHVHRLWRLRERVSPYTRAMAVAEHWLRTPHWSTDIPLDSPHPRLDVLAERGFVVLRDLEPAVPESEYLALEYMDWKSGGDTNFAPIATADGELECRGFWKEGDQRPDKGGRFTSNAALCPTLVAEVQSVGADFGRVRTIKLEPQGYDDALRQIHRDDNNRFNPDDEGWVVRSWTELTDFPDSFMILMEQGPDGLPDPATEVRLPLHRGARFVLDTQRLWHVVCHPADAPRYALIASYESGPALDAWIASQLP